MPIIEWNESMSVGVRMLDQEHKHLVDVLNNLSEAIEKGAAHKNFSVILEEFVSYANNHSQHEESLFSNSAYPDATFHKNEHDRLKQIIYDFQRKYQKAPSDEIIHEFFAFTKDLFMNHALQTDMGYVKYLREAGFS